MDKERAGRIIAEARVRKGFTQVELARMLNVSQGSVGAWEIGYCFPRPKSMILLCDLLDIPIEELMKAG